MKPFLDHRRRLAASGPRLRMGASLRSLRAQQHLGLALEVDVGLAADVDDDAVDPRARERVGRLARVVVGDGLARLPRHEQRGAGYREGAQLRPDRAFADLVIAVEERQRALAQIGSLPSFSNDAERISFSPDGRSSPATIICSSAPTKLFT